MRHSKRRSFRDQVNFLRRQFLQDGELPFTDVLTEEVLAQALTPLTGWLDRIFSPLVTLRVFLGQVLGADHSCRAAVARLIAHRLARGQSPCSPQTGAYCQARRRLPESFFAEAARSVGRRLDDRAERPPAVAGARVYLFDGTTVTMPDTRENQAAYPQVYNQKPGLGFPIARIGAVISLACGAVVNLGFCRYAGKGQGEVSLLPPAVDVLRPGDVVLADCLTANWATLLLRARRRSGQPPEQGTPHGGLPARAAAGRLGPRCPLGQADVDPRAGSPDVPRAARVHHGSSRGSGRMQLGFRTRSVVVVTTLLDPRQTTKADLAAAVSATLERRTRPALDQVGDADGRAALQDAGVGAQGGLGARPGVQPHPHGDGPGRGDARRPAAVHQLHGRHADPGSLSAVAGARSQRRRRPLAPVSGPAGRHRQPSGRRPARPLRAATEKAEAP